MAHGNTIPRLTEKDEARFWRYVRKGEGNDACWEWIGARSGSNAMYGVMYVQGRQSYAHRVSWTHHNGPIPDGMLICHHCDNPPCVRPDHLFLGTSGDNVQDARHKGRLTGKRGTNTDGYRGERNGMARLTRTDVLQIRMRYKEGGITQAALADEFNITRPHVSGIIHRRFWGWLDD